MTDSTQPPAPRLDPPHSTEAVSTGTKKKHHNRILLVIALFKLLKTILLLVAGIALLVFRHTNLSADFIHLVNYLRIDPHNHFIDAVIDRLGKIKPLAMEILAGGTFFYAAMFSIEGLGLYFEKVWAEYLIIVDTVVLIPVEIFELAKKPTLLRLGLLVGNLLVLAYLIYLRIKAHRLKRAALNGKIQ